MEGGKMPALGQDSTFSVAGASRNGWRAVLSWDPKTWCWTLARAMAP